MYRKYYVNQKHMSFSHSGDCFEECLVLHSDYAALDRAATECGENLLMAMNERKVAIIEIERLRGIIERLPHWENCVWQFTDLYEDCNCPKREASHD